VERLFSTARKVVQQIAESRPIPQTPEILEHNSFDIGGLNEKDRAKIHVPMAKPLVRPSQFWCSPENFDSEGLGEAVDRSLKALADLGVEAPFIFLPSSYLKEVYGISGQYSRNHSQIEANLVLTFESKALFRTNLVERSGSLEALGTNIAWLAAEKLKMISQ
jgi:hypothetical protein